jgi:Arc/MetJ family transcription regulator
MKPGLRRTSIYLDMQLIEDARTALGTKTMSETVHAALEEVARGAALRSLTEWEFEYLTPEKLDELRRPRPLDPDKHWPGA